MFLVREAESKDLEDLFKLAGMANFINLPHNKSLLTKQISKSVQSFRSRNTNPREGEYMFVLEDVELGRVVGTSMMIAQHGTADQPHTFFSVVPKKKVSKSLHMGFLHQVLRLGFDYDGPTEIGGLVIAADYRGRPEKLGKVLSFARFLYIAARRTNFRDEVLCELMPPMNERGESPIWEEVGRKFTNLSYAEADRMSRRSKEFITSLFPEGDIYTCLLPGEAREAIGQVNLETMPVKKMLEEIGFQYRNMIDPFDGGPHYWAKTSAIDPVKRTKHLRFSEKKPGKDHRKTDGLLLTFARKGVRMAKVTVFLKGTSEFTTDPATQALLGLEDAVECHFLEAKK